MISAPTTGKTALQFGAISGVSVNVLLIGLTATGLSQFIPTLIYILAIPAFAFFLAGLFAARQSGKVSTGTLAGLLSGVIMIIILMVTLVIILLTLGHAGLAQYTMKNSQENIWIGFVVLTILSSCIMAGIGSGFGALGGLIGKKMSLLANQLYMPYPPASLPMRPYQEFSYQISSPPPPAQQHVYRLLPIWRVFYAVVFPLINVIAGLSLILKSLNSFGNSAFSLFMICFIILAVGYNTYYGIRMSMARLVTSPAGVMYYGVGFRIYAPWHQITGIDTVRKRNSLCFIAGLRLKREGFVLSINRCNRRFFCYTFPMPERINYYEYPRYFHSSRLIIMQICAGLGNVGSFSFETVHLSPYCNLGNCYVYFQ